MKEFVSNPKFNYLFKAKCVPQGKEATLILRLLGFIRFKLTLSNFAHLNLNKISNNFKQAVLFLDHNWGGERASF